MYLFSHALCFGEKLQEVEQPCNVENTELQDMLKQEKFKGNILKWFNQNYSSMYLATTGPVNCTN